MFYGPMPTEPEPEKPKKPKNAPEPDSLKAYLKANNCPCGGSSERFLYIRGVLVGHPSKGFWYCPDCQTRLSPNVAQGVISKDERKKLENLKRYYSNEGMGDMHAHMEVTACLIRGLTYEVPAP